MHGVRGVLHIFEIIFLVGLSKIFNSDRKKDHQIASNLFCTCPSGLVFGLVWFICRQIIIRPYRLILLCVGKVGSDEDKLSIT